MPDGDDVLSSGSFLSSDGGNFSSLCPNGSQWIWNVLGECTQDTRDMSSVVLGLLSIACFIVSSFPQYYSSCKTGNMDSALSIWFLLLWLAGDSYDNRTVLYAVGALYALGAFSCLLPSPVSPVHTHTSSGFRGRTLLAVDELNANLIQPFTTKEIIGFTFGSVSSMLYLCSRLPQIFTNFRRKSTEGVSFFLFALVILGNVTYGLSVLVKKPERGEGESSYIVHHLPWLIGSLGTLLLDLLISVQFMMYSKASQNKEDNEETAALLNN
ncbi:hypothetical protein PDJAM_G00238800 [Pangasius djambal]|uniref:Uncharacterized protein n=1 Tax=Pangasius djambal TaxID=1691987 RepID=A0ACC5YG93_9TELE|nr:hypothetical protein [Pangasius djambal]